MILYRFLKNLWLSIKYARIINKVYKDEHILENLSKTLDCELKQDWIGRVYAVINPYVKNGVYSPAAEIYELGSDTPVQYVVEKYVLERLIAAQKFIQANNLFDINGCVEFN